MSVIIMIFLLSILILVHEAGHFFAARFFKIKVDKFGFGLPIGPVLFQKQCGDVKILVHAFLLGGYVSFPDDEENCELPKDSPERFSNKPVYQRAIVASAGVVANILIAFVFVFITAAFWGHLPSGKYQIFVDKIVAKKTQTISVWDSGIQNGDQIVALNGQKISNTFSLLKFVQLSKSFDGKVDISDLDSTLKELKKLNPVLEPDEVIPTGVAIKLPQKKLESPVKIPQKVLTGLKSYKNDWINLSASQKRLRDDLDGKSVYVAGGKTTVKDVAFAITDNSRPLTIQVKRNGKFINLKPIIVNKTGLLGIKLAAKEILIPTKTPFQVLKYGTKYLSDNTYMLLYGFYQIFTGQIKLSDLHGIVAITKVGGDIIQNNGIFSGLLLTAVISIDLAIVNFLPIPALDGGHIMFLLIEKLRRKPLNEEIVEKTGNICFWFLILLMLVVVFNDIFGLLTKKF